MRNGASDPDLIDLITGIWHRREDRYSELRALATAQDNAAKKIEMYQIGG